jgi:hypothetical protein
MSFKVYIYICMSCPFYWNLWLAVFIFKRVMSVILVIFFPDIFYKEYIKNIN